MKAILSAKVASVFLVLSVCMFGYASTSSFGGPFPIPGAINIDADTPIYESTSTGTVVQIFFSDSVETLDKLTVSSEYIQINNGVRIGVQSTVNCSLNLTAWEPLPKNTAGVIASFTLDSLANWIPFTFYIGNLNAGSWYNVYIDGALGPSHLTASSEGVIGFAFAGDPGEHDFVGKQLAWAPETIGLLGLLMPFIALGIVLSVIGWVIPIWKEKKKPKVGDFIDLVIFIVVGVSLLTVIGLVINSLP